VEICLYRLLSGHLLTEVESAPVTKKVPFPRPKGWKFVYTGSSPGTC